MAIERNHGCCRCIASGRRCVRARAADAGFMPEYAGLVTRSPSCRQPSRKSTQLGVRMFKLPIARGGLRRRGGDATIPGERAGDRSLELAVAAAHRGQQRRRRHRPPDRHRRSPRTGRAGFERQVRARKEMSPFEPLLGSYSVSRIRAMIAYCPGRPAAPPISRRGGTGCTAMISCAHRKRWCSASIRIDAPRRTVYALLLRGGFRRRATVIRHRHIRRRRVRRFMDDPGAVPPRGSARRSAGRGRASRFAGRTLECSDVVCTI